MKSLIVILIILFILLLILFIFAFVMFRKTFKRRQVLSYDLFEEFLAYHNLFNERDKIAEGINFFKNAKKEEVEIVAYDGIKLKGYYIHNEQKLNKTIILAHGYHSAPYYDFSMGAMDYYKQGFDLLYIDERGHEHSEGKYITFGMKERYDLKDWVNYVTYKYPNNKIVLAGVSMGASTVLFSLNLSLSKQVVGAVCDCGYSDAFEEIVWTISKKRNFFVVVFISILNLYLKIFQKVSLKDTNAFIALKDNKIPVFIAHGEGDEVVPVEMGHQIYQVIKSYKDAIFVKDAKHAQSYIYDPIGYRTKVEAFLNNITK